MIFWRKKNNQAAAEQEARDEKLLHPEGEPAIEPSTEYEPEIDADTKNDIQGTVEEKIDDLKDVPVPEHTPVSDSKEAEELSDHSREGGWLSRLTTGLSKSSNKISQGITDILTKKKLDQDMIDGLEEVLITADLGPKTAAKIIEDFSKERFGKDIDEREIRTALAESMCKILEPVAHPLDIQKPDDGPLTILVCGVNGAGKTTTIGKMAYEYAFKQKKSVMLAACDTFRAAAIEQLQEWANRAHVPLLSKEIGADAAAVAFEAYEQAKAEGKDILMIDTAGRLQNKSNLMDELAKIIRVLKKQNENLPHAVLLVLDSTTGQNAFSQVEIFKEMVDVTGLIVTKLDGTAKGGVLLGLADQFGLPVHLIGVGEKIEDLSPFNAQDYAKSLLDVSDL